MGTIIGTGRHLPERVVANAEIASAAGVREDWIIRRTGIRERRVAAPGSGTVAMGTRAAKAALDDGAVEAGEIDLILVATSTPDHLTPPTAAEIQAEIGAFGAACFDIEAGFAGWLYALITADALIRGGLGDRALVIGVDKLSTVTDRADPQTGPLFGDGAGAVVLQSDGTASAGKHTEVAGRHDTAPGLGALMIQSSSWWADGRLAGALVRPGGGARRPFDERVLEERAHLLRMEGTRLFRQSVRTMAAQLEAALERAALTRDDLALVVPHQANLRIIDAFARAAGVPGDRVFINIDRYGNTGAATIPTALDEARRQGRIPPGEPVALVSFGAGATAGAVVLRG